MKIYSRSDMVYQDYSWTVLEDDDPKITGMPDSTLLSRMEGYEVLYFINKFADIYKLEKVRSGEKIERMIREAVPASIHSQEKIQKWIFENW